ncbi:MAG TPA: peptidylprolyl isomerase [Steroidobacteraceae bacterium]|nr:peptidylprolyl isomerase [Steroidobacteraceae bacterium]
MTVSVNGIAVAVDGAVSTEMAAVRELLRQRARALGLRGESEDGVIDELIGREVRLPEPSEAECERYYRSRPDRFSGGDLVEAAHILFAVTPRAPVAAIRAKAEAVLRQVRADPARFPGLARENSNCPSAASGGNLGQLRRGETVPEFEAAIFGAKTAGVLPQLIATRYGFHIVHIERVIPGRTPPFDAVRERVADDLRRRVRHTALRQYLQVLAGQADITGIDLDAAATPLLQ